MALPVTAVYAALSALLLVLLAVRVIGRRQTARIALGTGGDRDLEQRVRAHANAAEYIPLALILLGLAEGLGAPALALHALGLLLLAGRGLHALHLSGALPDLRWRVVSMSLTFTMIGLAALGLLGHAIGAAG